MRQVLFVCPTQRDYREIARLPEATDIRFFFHDYATDALENLVAGEPSPDVPIADPQAEIERILARFRGVRLDAVLSTDDYPGTAIAAVIARALDLRGVDPAVNLLAQHKYHARRAQRDAVPEATPEFELLDTRHPAPAIGFPLFVKPVKTCFSVGASRVDAPEQLLAAVRCAELPSAYVAPFARLLSAYSILEMEGLVLAETLLQGEQCTLDGYAQGGTVEILGIVDSVMFPGTMSFKRFEYPSRLPAAVQKRMTAIARRLMQCIGYREGMFNVEFMFDPRAGTVSIIEINPRMSSQFADLFEKVDGTNGYSVLLDVATGRAPRIERSHGKFRRAASCVLRTFANARVVRAPARSDIEAVEATYPDARVEILTRKGRNLSQELQDGRSYRYGLINLGGRDEIEIETKLSACLARLPFAFEPVSSGRASGGDRPEMQLSGSR